MGAGALALALGAAVLHAGWNVALAGAPDSRATTAGVLLFGALLLAPAALLSVALFSSGISAEAMPFIAASAALELAYFVLLARAYDGGEVSVVYPVARGSAPVLVLAAGALALGEGVPAGAVLGVLAVAIGVLLVGLGALRTEMGTEVDTPPPERRDLGFGLAIGAVIAAYTLVDSEGLAHADPVAYLALVTVPCAALYPLVTRTRPDAGARTALTAAATFGAYLLVLAALELAPAAPVAAVRETSVVIAALLAAAVLHERVSGAKLAGAVAVAGGVAAIAYS